MKRNLFGFFSVVLVVGMLLAACQPAAPAAPTTAPAQEQPTSAPAQEQPTTAPAQEQPTTAPAQEQPTVAPAAGAGRTDGRLDKIVFSKVEDPEPAVAQLEAGAIDIYAVASEDAKVYDKVKNSADLKYVETYGSSDQLILNTVACPDTTKFNPFTDAKIREAMNWAVDRNYVSQEILGGLGKPKFTALTSAFADYSRYADSISAIETKYAYNLEKAKEVVKTQMEAAGAKLNASGKWEMGGKPVTIIGLIRTEDARKEIGNYFANQLEQLGFTVDRQEKTRKEAGPIWQGDPKECKFGYYTAGWISTAISRDDGNMFVQYNTGKMQNIPLFNAYQPSQALQAVQDKLFTNNFANMDERGQLFKESLNRSMEESWWGVWVADLVSFSPYRSNVNTAYDLAGGIASAQLYPYTLRFADKKGGEMKIAQSGILVQPWNPIAGSNWTDDAMPQRATMDWGLVYNPYTGLPMPKMVEKASVTALKGLPINKSSDWVTLDFADKIEIPDDAWVDWDAASQKFVTAGEAKAFQANTQNVTKKAADLVSGIQGGKFDLAAMTTAVTELAKTFNTEFGTSIDVTTVLTNADQQKAIAAQIEEIVAMKDPAEQTKAVQSAVLNFVTALDPTGKFAMGQRDYSGTKTKTVVVYKPELFKTTWHDGSPMTPADFVFEMIATFDFGKPQSKVYNESLKSGVDTFLEHFKGVRITSTDPMTIETYDDTFGLDAEMTITDWYPGRYYPASSTNGMFAWHDLAPALLAEADGKTAFTTDKAGAAKIEWTSLIAGPSLDIQSQYLDKAITDKYLPYAPTMSQYVKPEEITARYANIKKFFDAHKHLFIGTGPYLVDQVFPVEGNLTLIPYEGYTFNAEQYAAFAAPKISVATVDGPTSVKAGEEATFNVSVTFEDQPYASTDLEKVSFILFNSKGENIGSGDAKMTAEGEYQVVLPADVTSKLEEGASKLNIVVSSKVVSIPTFVTYEFVATK